MFFILSKLLAYFIYPLSWVLAMALCAVIFKRKRKFFGVAAVVVFLVFSNGALLNQVASMWDYAPAKLPQDRQYSTAILLGGFIGMDKNGDGVFNQSCDRFIQAVKLYKTGVVKKILITGGSGTIAEQPLRYSSWVKGQMIQCGVPAQDILVEDESRNTFENASMSKPILQKEHLQPPYVLITSGYHMRRSVWVFEQEQLPVVPFPAHYIAGRSGFGFAHFLPHASTMDAWNIYIKEMVGYYVYKMKVALK
jgi:Uncharacterized conserved protein